MNVWDDIDTALLRLRRLWDVPTKVPTETGDLVDASTVLVVDAVRRQQPGDVRVADVARQLRIAPSTASRLISKAHTAGMLTITTSPADPRAKAIGLTPRGQELSTGSQRFRHHMLAAATRDWSTTNRDTFARLLASFADGIDNLPSPKDPPDD